MNFKKWVKSIQTTGYNGARMVLKFSSLNWKLDNPFYHSRRREMRLNSSGGKEISAHQNTTYWTDLFVRHFLFQTDYEADRDDLLFFIRKTGQTLFFVEIKPN